MKSAQNYWTKGSNGAGGSTQRWLQSNHKPEGSPISLPDQSEAPSQHTGVKPQQRLHSSLTQVACYCQLYPVMVQSELACHSCCLTLLFGTDPSSLPRAKYYLSPDLTLPTLVVVSFSILHPHRVALHLVSKSLLAPRKDG